MEERRTRRYITCLNCAHAAPRTRWRQIARRVRVSRGEKHVWAVIKCPECGSSQPDDEVDQ